MVPSFFFCLGNPRWLESNLVPLIILLRRTLVALAKLNCENWTDYKANNLIFIQWFDTINSILEAHLLFCVQYASGFELSFSI